MTYKSALTFVAMFLAALGPAAWASAESSAQAATLACDGNFTMFGAMPLAGEPTPLNITVTIAGDHVSVDGIVFKGAYQIKNTFGGGGNIVFFASDATGTLGTFQGRVNRFSGDVTLQHVEFENGQISNVYENYVGTCKPARPLF